MKQIKKLFIFLLLTNYSSFIHADDLSMTLSASMDMKNYSKFSHYKMVHSYPFFDFGDKTDDRILVQQSMDFYENANLEFKEIVSYDEFYQVCDAVLKKADLVKKFSDYIVSAHTLDIKTTIYTAWDKFIIPELQKEFKQRGWSEAWVESFDLVLKNVIDGVLDYYNIESSAVGLILTKKFANEITTKMFSAVTKSIGIVFAYCDAILQSGKLLNAVTGIVAISDNRVKQILYTLQFMFINDYVFKYNSNISQMKRLLEPYANNKKIHGFMDLWIAYVNKSGKTGELIFNAIVSAYNPFSKISRKDLLNYAEKSAVEVLNYINRYSYNGLYSMKLIVEYKKDKNTNKYFLAYSLEGTNSDKSLLVIPKNIEQFENTVLVKLESTLDIGTDKFEKISHYLRNTSLEDYEKERFVKSLRVNFKVNLQNSKKETLETLTYQTGLFFIPSYLVDVPSDFWANKYFAVLFNSGAMRGDRLGYFNHEQTIVVGELLKVATRYLVFNELKMEKVNDEVNGKKIPFAKYAKYLKEENINIGVNGKDIDKNYSELEINVTMGYATKVISNIMGEGISECSLADDKGWNSCSKPLKKECIISGEDGYFRADKLISRAEFSKILVRTKWALNGENLCNGNK